MTAVAWVLGVLAGLAVVAELWRWTLRSIENVARERTAASIAWATTVEQIATTAVKEVGQWREVLASREPVPPMYVGAVVRELQPVLEQLRRPRNVSPELAAALERIAIALATRAAPPSLFADLAPAIERVVRVIEERHKKPEIVQADPSQIPNDLERWVMLESAEFAQDERRAIAMGLFEQKHRWDQVRITLSTDPEYRGWDFSIDDDAKAATEPVTDANHEEPR